MTLDFKKRVSEQQMGTRLKDLLNSVQVVNIHGNADIHIRYLSVDSRRILPGTLFFAVKGGAHDGHQFVEETLEKGTVAVISEKPASKACPVTWVQVKDVRAAIAQIASAFYNHPEERLKLIGITGTNGKTTIATLTQYFLQHLGHMTGFIGSTHYDLGGRTLPSHRATPDAIETCSMLHRMVTNDCKYACMEMTSHGIDQKRIYEFYIEVAAFTNLTPDHLDYHKTMEDYLETKSTLFNGGNGKVPRYSIINIDDAYGKRLVNLVSKESRIMTIGTAADAQFRAQDIVLSNQGTAFTLIWPEGFMQVKTTLPGHYNVSNILVSAAILYTLDMDVQKAMNSLLAFPGVAGRMQRVAQNLPFEVFVDHAHTPDALTNVLGMLREITPGKVHIVFGCGGNRDKTKRPLMVQAAQALADFCWATSDNPRKETVEGIFEDMKKGIVNPDAIAFIPDRRHAIGLALDHLEPGDTLVVAGKGHETFQEFADTVVPFDDRLVTQELLAIKKTANY